jgi:hypothetical protein
MPRACTICTHPQRTAMERDLADAIPLRTIADRWSVSKTALIRHKADHLPERPTPPSPAISQPVFPVARTTRRPGPLRQTGRPVAPSTTTTITPLLESADVLFPEILHPKKRAFLAAFVTCGRRGRAAEVAGVKHQHYLYWFATDPAFSEAFARAERLCTHLIEDEILRRGLEGIDKPVFWQGRQVATVKDYDTTLLIFAAKGAMPEKYKDRVDQTHKLSPAMQALMAQWQAIKAAPVQEPRALPALTDYTVAEITPLPGIRRPDEPSRDDTFAMLDRLNGRPAQDGEGAKRDDDDA